MSTAFIFLAILTMTVLVNDGITNSLSTLDWPNWTGFNVYLSLSIVLTSFLPKDRGS